MADPGEFSSTPEAAQYLNNLKYKTELPKGSSGCPTVYTGKIMRQDVAVVTTGACQCSMDVQASIAEVLHDAAAICPLVNDTHCVQQASPACRHQECC